jgi:hypothetical protein
MRLDSAVKRIAPALISGVMLHFVLGLDPRWLVAWFAPIPLLLAAFEASLSRKRNDAFPIVEHIGGLVSRCDILNHNASNNLRLPFVRWHGGCITTDEPKIV